MHVLGKATLAVLIASIPWVRAWAETPLPDAIAAPGTTIVLSAHAQGSQVYSCKAGTDGKLTWTFVEPVAALTAGGKVVGRHYAGPTWEHIDGSAVVGKVISHRGSGVLAGVTTVQRINTLGGKLEGVCDKAGDSRSMPYAADYVFLRKG